MSELTGSNHRCRAQFKCAQTVVGQLLLEMDPTVCPTTTTTTTTTTTISGSGIDLDNLPLELLPRLELRRTGTWTHICGILQIEVDLYNKLLGNTYVKSLPKLCYS